MNKNEILDKFSSERVDILIDLNFIINKMNNLNQENTPRKELGLNVMSAFMLYSSIYEKTSKLILGLLMDVLKNDDSKSILSYLLAFSYRNPISDEDDMNEHEIIESFEDRFKTKKRAISSSFISKNKSLNDISFISSIMNINEVDSANFNSLINTNFTEYEKGKISLINSLKELEELLSNNYKKRNDAAHGQFKDIDMFSTNSMYDDAIISLLALKLYIYVISDSFNNFISTRDLS